MSPSGYVGLGEYMRTEGLALRLVPVSSRARNGMESMDENVMEQCLMNEPDHGYTDQHYGFRFRWLNNPHLYIDEVHRRMLATYRQAFLTLASQDIYGNKPDNNRADSVLNMMNEKIPHELFPMQYELLYQTSTLYEAAGDSANFQKYSGFTIAMCKQLLDVPGLQEYIDRRFSPYELMIDLYDKRGEYGDAIDLLNSLLPQAQGRASDQHMIQQKIYEMQMKDDEKQGKYAEGIAVAQKALAFIGNATDQNSMLSRQNFQMQIDGMRKKAGLPPDSASSDSAMSMRK